MDLGGSSPALGVITHCGGLLRGNTFGNVLNHADFPKVHSGDNLFAGSALVDYKVFAYLVYCNRLLSYPIIAARISKINNEPARS